MAGAVEAQAVVVALQHVVADELAHGERQAPVRAAVLERDRRAILGAEEHHGFAEDDPAERLAADLVIHRGDVPMIFQEHGSPHCGCVKQKYECAGRGSETAVLLPPLNLRLASDLIRGVHAPTSLPRGATTEVATDALAHVLVQVSALACAVPWVRTLALDPVRVGAGRIEITGARATIDADFDAGARPYGHMAIHPYPVELVTDVTLDDGTRLHVRPIRPEDAAAERAFVALLSEETRYFRFFYQLNELSPAMLARFTQVDYDREMALVAIDDAGGTEVIVGVARYTMNPGHESAEFALVVADAWQRRGVGPMLMERLVACAKARGLRRLEGSVLRGNRNMLKFAEAFGFTAHDDPDDAELVDVVLELTVK